MKLTVDFLFSIFEFIGLPPLIIIYYFFVGLKWGDYGGEVILNLFDWVCK